jgi:pyruvate-ferredoxin/flavodoxin oxidoreductase
MTTGMGQQKLAVNAGTWPLYRFDPRLADQGKNPLQLDSKEPSISFEDYAYTETRFKMLTQSNPDIAKRLAAEANKSIKSKWHLIKQMAEMKYGAEK